MPIDSSSTNLDLEIDLLNENSVEEVSVTPRSVKRKAADAALESAHTQPKRLKNGDSMPHLDSASHNVNCSPNPRSFSALPLLFKIRILACLVEWAKTNNKAVNNALQGSSNNARRPIGTDKWGNAYWYFNDHRLYCETPSRFNGPMHIRDLSDLAEWRVIASTEAEWTKFIRQLRHSRNTDEKSLYLTLSEEALPWAPAVLISSAPTHTPARSPSHSTLSPESGAVDPLNSLVALAQASASLPAQSTPGEPFRRKVGRPPKSSRPIEVAPHEQVRKVENDAPLELSASGRPVRQRHRTKFSDEFIEGDFAQVLNEQSGVDTGKPRRRRRSSTAQYGNTSSAPTSKPQSARNPLSASISAADTLHEIKHFFHGPVIAFPQADYHQLMMQQMAVYQQLPMLGLQYSPQQMASLAHVYGHGLMSPYPHNVIPPYFLPGPHDQTGLSRQGLLSSDIAVAALAQFHQPTSAQYPQPAPSVPPPPPPPAPPSQESTEHPAPGLETTTQAETNSHMQTTEIAST
eukprot:TRINITY_DN362_c0_g1_i1.p1 TRINITY_DN362_c0_g1~~TRINITY_DN362_c0_g1_i1.p1  ORF type:complete len:518 (-),score=76.49 TRINITY_DN362_c0_g1_i1:97-1650(-)